MALVVEPRVGWPLATGNSSGQSQSIGDGRDLCVIDVNKFITIVRSHFASCQLVAKTSLMQLYFEIIDDDAPPGLIHGGVVDW